MKCLPDLYKLTGIGILLSWKATAEARYTSPIDAPLAYLPIINIIKIKDYILQRISSINKE
jgi:hypothetical protein